MIRYHARWVFPVTRPPIRDGTVAVDGARIAYVGPRAGAPAGDDRDLGDAALLPGLVNAHTHLELTAFHGVIAPRPFREWILTLQGLKTEVMTRERYLDSAKQGIADGLRAGITTYADTCDSGVALEAMRAMGVRGIMYQEVFGPDPAQAGASLRALEEKLGALTPLADDLRALGTSPHAPYTVSDELFRRVAALGRPMAIHLAESREETALIRDAAGPFADGLRKRGIAVAPRGRSPVDLLRRLGVLDARPLLIHCVQVDDDDIGAIAAHDCAVAHCPVSNRMLDHGAAPLLKLLAAGVRVALGSDSMASNDAMDLDAEMLAATLGSMRDAHPVRTAPAPGHGHTPPAGGGDDFTRLPRLATIDGARALGLDARIGSLEEGKDADLAAFPILFPDALAERAPAVALRLAIGKRAHTVVVAGVERISDGDLLATDPTLPTRVAAITATLRQTTTPT